MCLSACTYYGCGKQVIDKNVSVIFNCTFRKVCNVSAFCESYYWLLLGTGIGFSVEHKCIKQLPNFINKFKITHKNYEYKHNKAAKQTKLKILHLVSMTLSVKFTMSLKKTIISRLLLSKLVIVRRSRYAYC